MSVISGLTACSQPTAMGEANSLIVIAPDSLWQQVEQQTYDVLEPVIFTTRDEKQYVVTGIDPSAPAFNELRIFRNVLVFGTDQDSLVQRLAESAGVILGGIQPGRVFQVADHWARGQTVTVALLRRQDEVNSWVAALPSVLNAVDESYRAYVLRRMFATPPDTALAADLGRRFGFSIDVPEVYDRIARGLEDGDSVFIARNDNPDPSQLIRSVLVAWRPTVDSLTRELALEWRAALDDTQYNVAQGIDDTNSNVIAFDLNGSEALEVTGVWRDERGDFPAAGPFVVWLVNCPERTYFVDAYLYAPNEPKYEYMLQLQEILGSFRCVSA
ncbi:MAG: DUF4837 family protein [Gemmatimonadetes bacterium]|nr:DUF4837 family protein [Gemmatimonadota bacterium]